MLTSLFVAYLEFHVGVERNRNQVFVLERDTLFPYFKFPFRYQSYFHFLSKIPMKILYCNTEPNAKMTQRPDQSERSKIWYVCLDQNRKACPHQTWIKSRRRQFDEIRKCMASRIPDICHFLHIHNVWLNFSPRINCDNTDFATKQIWLQNWFCNKTG